MQNTHKLFGFDAIVASIVFTVLSLTGCDNGTTSSHAHQWGEWQVTTAPTCTAEGEETKICLLDTTHKETRSIAALGHDWGNWAQTTASTYTTEGVETRTCTRDATHTETRSISRIPFTSVAGFGTWLTSQPANTVDTAYTIALNIDDVADFATLFTTLNNSSDKYVYLDLSGSTITTIPENAFFGIPPYGCATLIGITIPNNVTSIGYMAFGECTNLVSVTIPNSVTSIGDIAFGDCTSLASITISNNVTNIGLYVFLGCTSLTAINVDVNNSVYTAVDGVLYNKNKTTLIQYPAGKTGAFTIPDSVTSIVDVAFSYSANLESVTIPNSVTSIGAGAFYGCANLTKVTIPNSITNIGQTVFYDCTNLNSVTFEGTIISENFSSSGPFFGDLRARFYATDPINGTPGTYTTTAPVSSSSVWTKQ